MITLRTLPQLKSFLKRNEHLKPYFGFRFRSKPGFYFTMRREHYQEWCNYGDHEWVLQDVETVHQVLFVPKGGRATTSKRYQVDEALALCHPDLYGSDSLPF